MRFPKAIALVALITLTGLAAEAPRSEPAAQSPARFAFLLPAEGDVVYETSVQVVGRLARPLPAGAYAELDGRVATRDLAVENGIVRFGLSGLTEGAHALRLAYRGDDGVTHVTATVRFFVHLPEPPPAPPRPKLKQFGRVSLRGEWKNDEAAGRALTQAELRALGTVPETDTTYAYDTLIAGRDERAPRNFNGAAEVTYGARYARWEADVKGLVSTNENRFRQPVNRLSGSLAYGPWAFVKAGDVYPEYNPLIFEGTRLRGGEAGVAFDLGRGDEHAAPNRVYARAAAGETQRVIPAYIVRSAFNGAYDTAYVAGTHAQSVRAFRLGVGGGEAFDVGVSVMKALEIRDDSVAESVNDYLYGSPPAENLVGGFDARAGFSEGRIQLYARGALSAYTRDRSLGAFSADTGAAFRPARYRRVLVINPTTNGWEYLVTDGGSPDYTGFLDAASAYATGASVSWPLRWAVWETDVSYRHLGSAYRSETNPFLGANPGDGWTVQQRLGFLENRLHLGAEASTFLQPFEDFAQRERAGKLEARYTTESQASSAWINGGMSRQTPEGDKTLGFSQDFDEMNVGGSHQKPFSNGSLNLQAQYGFTRGAFRLHDPDPEAPMYPATYTHALSSSVLYKFRDSDFIPKASHVYSDNGVQKPVHTVGLGLQDAWFERRLKADVNVSAGQYARSATRNGPSFSQNAAVTVKIKDRQFLRLNEKSLHYGERVSVIAGANYERSF